MTKVLIVDDHAILRRGLAEILKPYFGAYLVDEAQNGVEAIEKIARTKYDIILLDISMPGMNGIEVLKTIRTMKEKTPVLFLSMFPEEEYAIRSLKAGASGYISKESDPEEIVKAIKLVLSGKKYLSELGTETVVKSLLEDSVYPLHKRLSDREYEVMCEIASGKTLSQISKELFLSVKTISTYRSRILTKLSLGNTAQIIQYAVTNGLVKF